MKNLTNEPVAKDSETYVDLRNLTNLIEALRVRVGNVRGNDRFQLAHKTGVSAYELRKFQTPGMFPDLDTLQALIAHYYPGEMQPLDGGLQKRTSRGGNYQVKLAALVTDNGVEYF